MLVQIELHKFQIGYNPGLFCKRLAQRQQQAEFTMERMIFYEILVTSCQLNVRFNFHEVWQS